MTPIKSQDFYQTKAELKFILIKVLHCPKQVAGFPEMLSFYERMLGFDSLSISESYNPYSVNSNNILFNNKSNIYKRELKRLLLIYNAYLNCNILHLNNGQFITPHFGNNIHPHELGFNCVSRFFIRFFTKILTQTEMSLSSLRINNKAIFLTFQGSDARETQCFINRYQKNNVAKELVSRSGRDNSSIRKKKIFLSQIAHKIYALNPDLLEVLPKTAEFLPYLYSFKPEHSDFNIQQNADFIIGHAPTHRLGKGTDLIIKVVESIQKKFPNIKLVLIEKLSHSEALKKYQEIDLFIDQLIIGWYGLVALELLALGKPVICFVKGKGLRFVPPQMLRDLPIINADEITLEEKILEVMNMDSVQKGNLADRGIEFLQNWHNPQKIAQRVVDDYKVILSQRNFARV